MVTAAHVLAAHAPEFCVGSSAPDEGSGAPGNAGACEAPGAAGEAAPGTPCEARRLSLRSERRASRRSACGVFLTASGRAFGIALAMPSASSWQGAVVPPGGAPTPPGCRLRAGSAGAAPVRGPELPGAGCRTAFWAESPAPLSGLLRAQDAS